MAPGVLRSMPTAPPIGGGTGLSGDCVKSHASIALPGEFDGMRRLLSMRSSAT